MRKYCFILLLSVTSIVNAQDSVKSFTDLMKSLKEGKAVRAVIYYGKCSLYSDAVLQTSSPDAIGGMKLEPFEYFDSTVFHFPVLSFVTSSQTILINHPSYGYVYNYVKIKIRSDNSVEITARYLKPKWLSKKYRVVMDETFKTVINNGTNKGGLELFK